MYCSHPTCRKEVDINSVMKQQTSGGMITDLTDNDFFVSRTQNKLINVCKSCGETDYLWKTEAEYKDHLNRKERKAIAKKKG